MPGSPFSMRPPSDTPLLVSQSSSKENIPSLNALMSSSSNQELQHTRHSSSQYAQPPSSSQGSSANTTSNPQHHNMGPPASGVGLPSRNSSIGSSPGLSPILVSSESTAFPAHTIQLESTNSSAAASTTNLLSKKPLSRGNSRRATTLDVPGLTRSKVSPDGTIAARDVEAKLVIVMVGLPARGKSYVTKKLCRYLNWQQHNTQIFNVGNTRRKSKIKVGPAIRPLPDHQHQAAAERSPDTSTDRPEDISCDIEQQQATSEAADFFSPDNEATSELRERWAMETLDSLLDFILDRDGSVGILDATNTTIKRRKKVYDRIHERSGGRLRVLFLESICTDPDIIEANIRLKLTGPDYKNMDPQLALRDFRERLHNYEKVYETIGDEEEDYQYIKMINVGKKVVCNNIKGFLAGQAVFFLLNFNLSPRQIWIARHGESIDNARGRIGGDADLTPRGRKFANALARFMDYQKTEFWKRQLEQRAEEERQEELEASYALASGYPVKPCKHKELEEPHFCVWTSMLRRSIQTAEPFSEEIFDIKEMRMLNELGAGEYDGMTYAEIQALHPQEYNARVADKIRYRYPGIGGESYLDVINRLRPVIVEIERMEDSVLVVGHRVVARVLLAYFMNLGRDAIGDLDVPLHTLYMMEPKPYGVDWAVYEYHEDTDWFYRIPKETLQKRNASIQKQQAIPPSGSNANSNTSTAPSSGTSSTVSSPSRKADNGPVYFHTKDRTFSVVPTSADKEAVLGELRHSHSRFQDSGSSRRPPGMSPVTEHTSSIPPMHASSTYSRFIPAFSPAVSSPALSTSSESSASGAPDVSKLSLEEQKGL